MAYQAPQQNYAQGRNVQSQEWSSSLCDCSPCDACLLGTCLPCVLLGRTSDRMRDPTGQTHDTMNSDCMVFCGIQCVTGCGWIYAMMKRGEIRERYGIEGSGTSDCCTTYWCLCCALIQQDKEVATRNAAGPITAGYQSNKEGMHMPGQQQPQQQQQRQMPQQQQQQQQQHNPQQQYQQQQHPSYGQQQHNPQQQYQQQQHPSYGQGVPQQSGGYQVYGYQQSPPPQMSPHASPPPQQHGIQPQHSGYASPPIEQAPPYGQPQQQQQGYPYGKQ